MDTGALGESFMDYKLATSLNLEPQELKYPRTLELFDGTETTTGKITHVVHTSITLGGKRMSITSFLTSLPHQKFILGLPWFRRHRPIIDWTSLTVSFPPEVPPAPPPSPPPQRGPEYTKIFQVNAAAFTTAAKQPKAQVFAASLRDIDIALEKLDKKQYLSNGQPTLAASFATLVLAPAYLDESDDESEPEEYASDAEDLNDDEEGSVTTDGSSESDFEGFDNEEQPEGIMARTPKS
uniref:Uncharacterized protein n=1 Tax=Passalora fulva TaxID=5499 RepID=A0A9Q8PBW2_PASFU